MEILQRGFERISETIFATIKIRWCGQCNSSDQVFYRKWLHQIFRRNSAYIAPHPVKIESFVRIWYSSLQVFFLPQVSTYKVTLEHCPIAIVQVLSLSLLSTLTLSENYFLQPLFLTSTAPLSLSFAGRRIGEEHNTEINSRPPFKGNPIMRFCTNERGRNGKIYYIVKNLRPEFVFFDKSKNTQEIQGQWLGYLSQQQGAWELFWTKIKIWPCQSNWVSKAFSILWRNFREGARIYLSP